MRKILALCLCLCAFSHARSELFMMPYEQAQALKSLQTALKTAQKSIDISIYSFTNRELAKTLRDSAKRGVKVRIIFDEGNRKDSRSVIGYLDKYNNITACLLKGKKAQNGNYHGIMHQKMAIIDENLLFIGSANWSKNAFENNYETLFYDDDTHIVRKSLKYFEDMFASCKPF
ncbi:nuclease NucT [Helicobacter sp. CLO-3]|uniref:phospholipase D-like domain-containing protein n=1 Tax=unclassified Helicobacter TaxID=2593540 RepID=UPI000805FE1E|nr:MULTISPECIES: phospholipase D-like domain-containing protein [unclassified Helicobacter]OBV28535.1 nuclease NucT [Helicobacter sp. CLO-3]OHU83927.1 nuclease NucT [Helicobacter sp. CLO-3]